MHDIIDLVSITPAAAQRWNDYARETALSLRGVPLDAIGVEQIFAQGDGTLRVSCPIAGQEPIEMILSASEWTWSDGRN